MPHTYRSLLLAVTLFYAENWPSWTRKPWHFLASTVRVRESASKFHKRRTMGHTPSTAGTFRKKFRKNSGKTPETLSERFLEFPSRVRLGCPKPHNSRHLRLPECVQNSPPQYGWGCFFFQKWFRRGPLRAGHGVPSSTGGINNVQTRCIIEGESQKNPLFWQFSGGF